MITITDDPYYVVPPVTEKTPKTNFVLLHLRSIEPMSQWLAVPFKHNDTFSWRGIHLEPKCTRYHSCNMDLWDSDPRGESFCGLLISTMHYTFRASSDWDCTVYIINDRIELLQLLESLGVTPEYNAYDAAVYEFREWEALHQY